MKNLDRDPDDLEMVDQRTVSDWIDAFEQALRQQERVAVSSFFPEAGDPEFETVVTEVLRILLEWRWAKGERGWLKQLLAENDISWIRDNIRILTPVAFEDYRLRTTGGLEADRDSYRTQYGIDVHHWDRWLENPDVEGPDGGSSTVSGNGQTVVPNGPDELSGPAGDSDRGVLTRRNASVVLPEAGSQIGDFDLVHLAGSGAFSRVFVARQSSLARRLIVLKITTTPLGESQQLARLQHGNIMPLYFAQHINGLYVLGMPLLGLATLKQAIESRFRNEGSGTPVGLRNGQLIVNLIRRDPQIFCGDQPESPSGFQNEETDVDQLVMDFEQTSWENCIFSLGQRLADGLQYSHSRGVQHRDIKPANILLGFDGQPLLLDFNLSRLEFRESQQRTRAVGGTLPYMSPEHLESMNTGIDHFTRGSDVYSLGVVLYEALTGQLPHESSLFLADNLAAAIETRRQPIRNPRDFNPSIRPAAASVVMKCLEQNPQDRYLSAAELAVDLKRHLADLPLRYAANPSWTERAGKFRRRHGRIFSVASVAIFAVLMGSVAIVAGIAWRQNSLATLANERYQKFVELSHVAEAELFFADGGSRELGRHLANRALNIFEFNESSHNLESASLPWLKPGQREDVGATARLLWRLSISDPASAATNDNGNKPVTALERAAEDFMKRDYSSAVGILERELEKSHERFAVWFLKGKCHFELREYRDAERCFAVAGMVDPDSAMSMVARGSCHFFMSQYDDAKRFFEAARRLDTGNFAALYNLALVDERQREPGSALEWLELAEKIRPGSTRVEMARSRIARAMGNEQLAKDSLERVILQEPTEPEGWVLRGLARLSQSPADAVSDFEMAQRYSTTRFVAGQNRAHVLSEYLKRPEEAIQVLSDLLEEDPHFMPALSGRAVLYARGGNRDAALADVQRCTELPMTPQLHYQVACVCALLGAGDDSLQERALHHLAIATAPAYGAHVIATDADLKSLEGSREFQALRNGIRTGNQLQQANQQKK